MTQTSDSLSRYHARTLKLKENGDNQYDRVEFKLAHCVITVAIGNGGTPGVSICKIDGDNLLHVQPEASNSITVR